MIDLPTEKSSTKLSINTVLFQSDKSLKTSLEIYNYLIDKQLHPDNYLLTTINGVLELNINNVRKEDSSARVMIIRQIGSEPYLTRIAGINGHLSFAVEEFPEAPIYLAITFNNHNGIYMCALQNIVHTDVRYIANKTASISETFKGYEELILKGLHYIPLEKVYKSKELKEMTSIEEKQ